MKKTVTILLVLVIMLYYPCLALSQDQPSLSFSAVKLFCSAWNKYYQTLNYDLVCDYYSPNDNEMIDLLVISFNEKHLSKNFGIDGIPKTANVLISYYANTSIFSITVVDNSLSDSLESVVFYTDNGIMYPISAYSDYNMPGLWMITIDYDILVSLFMSDSFLMKVQTNQEVKYIELSKKSNSILYTMVAYIVSAKWYCEVNSEQYRDASLLPDDYNNEQNFIPQYSFQEDYEGINQRSMSIFYVEMYDSKRSFIGNASGFVAFSEHLFITNQHVIQDASYLKIWDEKQNVYEITKVLISDKKLDLAILAFPNGNEYSELDLNLHAELMRGQPVMAIGSPKGMQNTVSPGIISGLPVFDGMQMIQFTAPISHGSSGGVLFDNQGKVIGITSSAISDGANLGFAIPVDYLEDLYRHWDKKSSVTLGSELSWDTVNWKQTITSTPRPTITPKAVMKPTPTPQSKATTPPSSSKVYYFSNTGSYYHLNKNCSELKGLKSFNMGSATYAQSIGYKPCPDCVLPSALVYYSFSGIYYHIDKGCTELSGLNSFNMGSVAFAQSIGYKPCPICIH